MSKSIVSKIEIRPYWQMAVFGVVGLALCEIPLAACRGVGLIDWSPELIPGKIIGQLTVEFTSFEDWAIYALVGALGGFLYRFVFSALGRSGWAVGMCFGVVDWTLTGLIIGLIEPYFPNSPLILPSESPDQSAYGMTSFLIIFLLNVFFGMWMGLVATRDAKVAEADQTTISGPPRYEQRAA